VQTGINVVGALVYPTSLRANGSGWELGIGRIGSIVGPLVGALFVGLPVQHLYIWSSLPFLGGAIVCFVIHRLNQARLRERPYLMQPDARQPAATPKRPSEPQVPANAEHFSPFASVLILVIIVGVILGGGWALSNNDFGISGAKNAQQSAGTAATPSRATTGTAVR
jgi:MFS family permease